MHVVLVWLSAFTVMHAYYFKAVMSSERVLFALEVVRALGLEYKTNCGTRPRKR